MDIFLQSLSHSNPKPAGRDTCRCPPCPMCPLALSYSLPRPLLLALVLLQILLYLKENCPDLAVCRTTTTHHLFALTLNKNHFLMAFKNYQQKTNKVCAHEGWLADLHLPCGAQNSSQTLLKPSSASCHWPPRAGAHCPLTAAPCARSPF